MPAVGLYGADLARVGVGATVVVIGLGMIGLGVVSAAVRRGAVVIGIDPRAECRVHRHQVRRRRHFRHRR